MDLKKYIKEKKLQNIEKVTSSKGIKDNRRNHFFRSIHKLRNAKKLNFNPQPPIVTVPKAILTSKVLGNVSRTPLPISHISNIRM